MNHFDPSFVVRYRACGHCSLRGINVRYSTDGTGTAITTRPIGASQTRVGKPGERSKQNQIESEKQSKHRDGAQFEIHRLVPIVVQGPHQGQECNEHTHAQQSQRG